VPGESFELAADLEELVPGTVGLVQLAQLRNLGERLVDRRVEREGDHLGDPVHVPVRQVERPPTSRMTARAAIVPNVMIWATFSRPYFSVT
jgi:hypothetical protein